MMAPDSQMVKSLLAWSTSVGMRPLGFLSVYGACLCSPVYPLNVSVGDREGCVCVWMHTGVHVHEDGVVLKPQLL